MENKDFWSKPFKTTTLCREDLILNQTFTKSEAEQFDDADMAYIAQKIGDACVDSVFWDVMKRVGKDILSDKKAVKNGQGNRKGA